MIDVLQWVLDWMPDESARALARVLEVNPRLRGAHWDDVLEMMMDADAHLDVWEPMCEWMTDNGASEDIQPLAYAIVITLIWSTPAFLALNVSEQCTGVKATIVNNNALRSDS